MGKCMKQGMHYTDVEWIFRGNAALFVLIIMELDQKLMVNIEALKFQIAPKFI